MIILRHVNQWSADPPPKLVAFMQFTTPGFTIENGTEGINVQKPKDIFLIRIGLLEINGLMK